MKDKNMKWIERIDLKSEKEYDGGPRRFDIEVPVGAEFIGAQHNATILVMLVRDRWGARNLDRSNRNMEKRSVIRVRDGAMVVESESRYIGSHNMWHLFEVMEVNQ